MASNGFNGVLCMKDNLQKRNGEVTHNAQTANLMPVEIKVVLKLW